MISFIRKFLSWYQQSYSISEVNSRIQLEELVKQAEQIWSEYKREEELKKRIFRVQKRYLEEVESDLSEGMIKEIVRKVKKRVAKRTR